MTGEGRAVAGRYRLVERIGSGAMGVVWRAHDERLHRTVAVKELLLAPGLSTGETDEAIQRAMREGRIAARLHHPNAISVFDVVEEDGVPCLVMEYLPSRSLSAVMAERGALPPREVARIGAQVAAALAAAHSAGIVHRDIKPGNVLLGDDGTVKITDFGISRATDDVTVTKTGLIAGTPAYLAPEVALGRDPAPPSDVFSLGSTLYAAVEGEPPFGLSENTLGLLHAVAAGQINPPQHAGPLADVLRYLLRADPTERPTAGKTRDVLHAVADGRIPDVPVVGPDAATSLLADETARYAQGTQVLGDSPNQAPTQHVGGGTRAQTAPVPPGRPSGKRRKGLVLSGLALAALLIAGLLLAPMLFNHKGQGQQPVDNRPTGAVPNPLPPAPTGVVEETTTRHTTKATTTSQQPVTSERPTTTTTSERPTTTSQQPTTTSKTTSSPPTTGTTSPTS